MAEISVVLVVGDEADFGSVQAASKSRGLTRVDALPRLRILRGFIDERRLGELARVPGVRSVEKEKKIQLPPPGAPVQ